MKKIYLDYSASTPAAPEVVEAMEKYHKEVFANASSIHQLGREAKVAMELVREEIAESINAEPGEIFFNSGGTESDNLSTIGFARANRDKGNHIITSSAEHHAVLHSCAYLEKEGYTVTYLPVNKNGWVDPDDVKNAICDDTILISLMHVNNESGAINPLERIGEIAFDYRIAFHSDAVQSFSKIPVDVNRFRLDMIAASAHKFYGPKGVGFLFKRKGIQIQPLLHGGSQEMKIRSGTPNVPGIIGMGKAVRMAMENMEREAERILALRNMLWDGIRERIPEAVLNGSLENRMFLNLNTAFPSCDGEALLLNLDLAGVMVTSGSACASGSLTPSHVLSAMGVSGQNAQASIRFSLGRFTTEEDIRYVLDVLPECVSKSRKKD